MRCWSISTTRTTRTARTTRTGAAPCRPPRTGTTFRFGPAGGDFRSTPRAQCTVTRAAEASELSLEDPEVDARRHSMLVVMAPQKFEQRLRRRRGLDYQDCGRMRLEVAEQRVLRGRFDVVSRAQRHEPTRRHPVAERVDPGDPSPHKDPIARCGVTVDLAHRGTLQGQIRGKEPVERWGRRRIEEPAESLRVVGGNPARGHAVDLETWETAPVSQGQLRLRHPEHH